MENTPSWATVAGMLPLGAAGLVHRMLAKRKLLANVVWTYETIRVEGKDGPQDRTLLIGPDSRIWAALTPHGAEQFALEPGEQVTVTVPSRMEKAVEKAKEPEAPPPPPPAEPQAAPFDRQGRGGIKHPPPKGKRGK